jgi:hypothetical protein
LVNKGISRHVNEMARICDAGDISSLSVKRQMPSTVPVEIELAVFDPSIVKCAAARDEGIAVQSGLMA